MSPYINAMVIILHIGMAFCTVASEQEGPGFESTIFLCRVYMLSVWVLHGFSLDTLTPASNWKHAVSGVRLTGDARIAYFKAILKLKHKMFTVWIGKLPKMVAL